MPDVRQRHSGLSGGSRVSRGEQDRRNAAGAILGHPGSYPSQSSAVRLAVSVVATASVPISHRFFVRACHSASGPLLNTSHSSRSAHRVCTGGALLPPRAPLADSAPRAIVFVAVPAASPGPFSGRLERLRNAPLSQRALRFAHPRRPLSSRRLPSSRTAPRCLTPACSGLAALAADARR
jgi:hypothetical protein